MPIVDRLRRRMTYGTLTPHINFERHVFVSSHHGTNHRSHVWLEVLLSFQTIRLAAKIAATCLSVTVAGGAQAQASPNAPLPRLLNKLFWPEKKPTWSPVSTVDVAGVKLGMSPEQVRAALKAGGFTPRATDPDQSSWSAMVADKLAERGVAVTDRTKVPMFTMASGPQGEHVEVWYAATRQGAQVSSVKYLLPTNRMERAAFLTGVKNKYGQPTTEDRVNSLYCSAGEQSCVTYQNKQLPHLMASVGYSNYEVFLRNGTKFSDDYRAEMASAIEAGAPKRAKATF